MHLLTYNFYNFALAWFLNWIFQLSMYKCRCFIPRRLMFFVRFYFVKLAVFLKFQNNSKWCFFFFDEFTLYIYAAYCFSKRAYLMKIKSCEISNVEIRLLKEKKIWKKGFVSNYCRLFVKLNLVVIRTVQFER